MLEWWGNRNEAATLWYWLERGPSLGQTRPRGWRLLLPKAQEAAQRRSGAGERLIKLAREGYGPQTLHSRFALAWGSPVHNTLVLSVLREGRSKDLSPLVGAVTINKYRATLPLSDLTGSGFERSEDDHTASDFLAVLADPQANKICSLFWWYEGREDVNLVILLLINNCPELASLQVEFRNHSVFDFVSSMLEHPSNKLKVLEMPGYPEGDSARFFAALGQSQVSALTLIHSPVQGFYEYLAKDLLVRLKSIARLELDDCAFVGDFDWSFLADSNVQDLDFLYVRGVDGRQLGGALAVHLRAKGLDRLRFSTVSFTNEILAAVGVELGRVKRLKITSSVNNASVAQIALALKSPNSELRELVLPYGHDAASI
ncbi:hypothetical protein BASA62_003421 [Batrachochytrium salamandrivorans]|nr:hypothetical protein BASA62_003421 [Batrachochytrium salamandrivorans]